MQRKYKLVNVVLFCLLTLLCSGTIYVAIYAALPNVQSTQSEIYFDAESGIRYNSITGEFEVFNGIGVSWIASGGYVKVDGTTSTEALPIGEGWYEASINSRYNIMRDIVYSNGTGYHPSFNSGITLGEQGIINGRGFKLTGFPVKTVVLNNVSYGTALVAENSGIIKNLTMANDSFVGTGTFVANSLAGIVAGINKEYGLIESCEVSGVISTNIYARLFGIAGYNEGTILKCTNNANITNTATATSYAAGISSLAEKSNLVNNTNNGIIKTNATNSHAAGIAICTADVEIIVNGNVNNGLVEGKLTSCGILGGGVILIRFKATNNFNNVILESGTTFSHYHGHINLENSIQDYRPISGIKWNPIIGAFQIYNTAGVTYIDSGYWISTVGLISDVDEGMDYKQATADANYRIMNDIVYDDDALFYNEVFRTRGPSIGRNSSFDGGGYTLSMFPIRYVGDIDAEPYYSALFFQFRGVLRNLNMYIEEDNDTLTGGNVCIGGVVAEITGLIIGCSVSGFMRFSATTFIVGGFTASLYSPSGWGVDIINCYSNITITANSTTASIFAGYSAVGSLKKFLGVINFGDISGALRVGGMSSGTKDFIIDIERCTNYGNITGKVGSYAGGLHSAVDNRTSVVFNCRNYGDIYGEVAAGGLIGYIEYEKEWSVSRLTNLGDVICPLEGRAGAILGWSNIDDVVTISNCTNYGGVGTSIETLVRGNAVPFLGGSDVYVHGYLDNYSPEPVEPQN